MSHREPFLNGTIDIFLDKLHNEGIKSKLDAWLTFLGCDEPEMIVKLITEYPEFEPMYTHLYDLCRNIEGVMKMFSKELQIMDRNTVTYMIDSLQEKLDIANEQLEDKDKAINDKDKTIKDKDKTIAEKDAIIKKLQDELNKKK
ncbi:MAG: hypothetical protein II842_05415 [Butyrivibrio sp.]|nr:hypothetical protein [Butyrivibrio sp.]